MPLADRINEALKYISLGNAESALVPACIAVDATAEKSYPKIKFVGERYMKFIQENLALITKASFAAITFSGSLRQKWSHPDLKPSADGFYSFEEIVYHMVRCSLIHNGELPDKVHVHTSNKWEVTADGTLWLPNGLPFGLVLAAIAAPVNSNLRINPTSVPQPLKNKAGMWRRNLPSGRDENQT